MIERFGNPHITVLGFKYHVVQHGFLLLEALSNLVQHLKAAGIVIAKLLALYNLLVSPELEKLVDLGIWWAKVPHGIIATYRASCGQKTNQEV
jgi:hypothetical protein